MLFAVCFSRIKQYQIEYFNRYLRFEQIIIYYNVFIFFEWILFTHLIKIKTIKNVPNLYYTFRNNNIRKSKIPAPLHNGTISKNDFNNIICRERTREKNLATVEYKKPTKTIPRFKK